ncbi:MAG: hypothetical protein EOM67_13430 [Spirochaetia bacterium]|nr:hypothetical protein [Spirochaetia bacterium]
MKHINRFRAPLGALLITLVIFTFSSCFLFQEPTIPVVGEWELTGSFGTETWDITESTISYDGGWGYGYTADIITIGLNTFNAGDMTITSSGAPPVDDYGYAVIKYTSSSDAGTGEVGKYNIFRWQDNEGDQSKKDFGQGYKQTSESNYDNLVFNTASQAQTGATNTQGYFSFVSSGASKVE